MSVPPTPTPAHPFRGTLSGGSLGIDPVRTRGAGDVGISLKECGTFVGLVDTILGLLTHRKRDEGRRTDVTTTVLPSTGVLLLLNILLSDQTPWNIGFRLLERM